MTSKQQEVQAMLMAAALTAFLILTNIALALIA